MAKWWWKLIVRTDRQADVLALVHGCRGFIHVADTFFIEPQSESYRKIIDSHYGSPPFRYHEDYNVYLIHAVSLDESNQFDNYLLDPKSLGISRIHSEWQTFPSQCTGLETYPHTVYPKGIAIIKPPKKKYDIFISLRGLIISKKALDIFLGERIESFDYKPIAVTRVQKRQFEVLTEDDQRKVEAEWWELIPRESKTICAYDGPSEICPKCHGWLRITPKYTVSIPKTETSDELIPNRWNIYYPIADFEAKDIQKVKWIRINGKVHEMIYPTDRIVSRRFIDLCRTYDLRGYYTPGTKKIKDDLIVIEHQDQQIFWI